MSLKSGFENLFLVSSPFIELLLAGHCREYFLQWINQIKSKIPWCSILRSSFPCLAIWKTLSLKMDCLSTTSKSSIWYSKKHSLNVHIAYRKKFNKKVRIVHFTQNNLTDEQILMNNNIGTLISKCNSETCWDSSENKANSRNLRSSPTMSKILTKISTHPWNSVS